jgi:hypothetical protein
MTFPPNPIYVVHAFQPAGWNAYFCTYCSEPKAFHKSCGHAYVAIGCETCTAAIFSKKEASMRRQRNLNAMRRRRVSVGGRPGADQTSSKGTES